MNNVLENFLAIENILGQVEGIWLRSGGMSTWVPSKWPKTLDRVTQLIMDIWAIRNLNKNDTENDHLSIIVFCMQRLTIVKLDQCFVRGRKMSHAQKEYIASLKRGCHVVHQRIWHQLKVYYEENKHLFN